MKILKLLLGNHIVRKTTEHFLHKNQRTLFCKENHKLYYELHNYKIKETFCGEIKISVGDYQFFMLGITTYHG